MDNPQRPPHRPPNDPPEGESSNGYATNPEDDLYAGTGDPEPEPVQDWSARYGQGAPPPPPSSGPDLAALFAVLDALRSAAPPELQERVSHLIREILLTLRSLIDWYLERLDDGPREPTVEDIPID
jgi:hypothetical protein